MAKLILSKGRAQHSIIGQSETRSGKSGRRNTNSAKEEQLLRNTVKQVVRIHREAFQELKKY